MFLDGSEKRGAIKVTLMAKYRRKTRSRLIRVWYPDFPLTVQLSDSKLSPIRFWKVAPPADDVMQGFANGRRSRRRRLVTRNTLYHSALSLAAIFRIV